MKKQCSMTELLSKINLTKKKIDYYTSSRDYSTRSSQSVFLGLKKKGEDYVNGKPASEMSDGIMDNYKSYIQSLKNWSKLLIIKNAVNSSTYINIAGSRMTIAEALAYNTESIKTHCKNLIDKMQSDYAKALRTIEDYNATKFSDANINAYVATALGGVSTGEVDRLTKENPDRIKDLVKQYEEINRMEFVDPLDIVTKINNWTNWYDEFFNTINFRLSEVNSRLIVEYDLDEDVDFFRIVNLDEVNNLYIQAADEE